MTEPGAAEVPRPPRPWVTLALIAANVAVFAAMLALGASPLSPDQAALLRFGANWGVAVVFDGEWWRALTYMFVHIGAVHLLVNMYSLWSVGGFVERLLGRSMFLAVYLLTGLAGAFGSVLWKPASITAGASGAIFGLFGFVIGFTFRAREQLPPQAFQSLRSSIVATLLFNLLFALNVPYLDHAAHLGGLSVGILAGVVATASAIERKRRASWGSLLVVAASVAGLGVLAATRTRNQPRVQLEVLLHRAQVACQGQQWAECEQHASAALSLREDPRGRLLRALARASQKQLAPALGDLDAAMPALERDDDRPELLAQALSTRGALRLGTADYRGAIVDLRHLSALLPDEPVTKNNLAWALIRVGGFEDEALALADQAVKADPSGAALGTRCFAYVAKGELQKARADCQAAVEKSPDDYVDAGMLRFIDGQRREALELWERAAREDPMHERDLEPWVALAKNGLASPGDLDHQRAPVGGDHGEPPPGVPRDE